MLAFVAAATPLSLRTFRDAEIPGHPEIERYGLRDFRDAVYYPERAFLDGNNPYRTSSYKATYPVGSKFPLYAPLALAVHLPFGLLPEHAAGIVFYVFNVLCVVLLAYVSLRLCGTAHDLAATFALAAGVLVSRPGHTNAFTGECTAYVVLGVYLALACAETRPWLAALGLTIAFLKPTFGLPLAILMLARREYHAAVARGLVIVGTVSALVVAILAKSAGGVGPWLDSIRENYLTPGTASEAYSGASVLAIDAAAFLERLLGRSPDRALAAMEATVSVLVLVLGAAALVRAGRDRNGAGRLLSMTIVCLVILLSIHHQAYDALVLTLPIVALASGRWTPRLGGSDVRRLLFALLLVPSFNYLATYTLIDRWRLTGWPLLIGTSANGGAVLMAFLLTVAVAFQPESARAAFDERPAHTLTA